MSKHMFFYTREENLEKDPAKEPNMKEFQDSFNINKVIRSMSVSDTETIVVLDDFHPEKRKVPIYNKKGVITGAKNEENTYQSELLLKGSDCTRFRELFEVK